MEFKNKTQKELVRIASSQAGRIGMLVQSNISKQSTIRHFRRRLFKIRNSIDYLLKHPFSMDNSYYTHRHVRDSDQKKKFKNR